MLVGQLKNWLCCSSELFKRIEDMLRWKCVYKIERTQLAERVR